MSLTNGGGETAGATSRCYSNYDNMFRVIKQDDPTDLSHDRILKATGAKLRTMPEKPYLCGLMSLFITSLNSGSNGNCYYVGNAQEAVLIDAGLSCRQTELRLQRLGLSIQRVKAVFISHEHSDHISGLSQLARKYQLPVYITPRTLKQSKIPTNLFPVLPFSGYDPVWIGDLCITAFPKAHDACDPHSFLVAGQGVRVGVFTDIGAPCQHLIDHFSQCHAVFLEANYDEQMLEQGRYPFFLKQRIRGGQGHLSNQQALDLYKAHKPAYMSHVLLSHLSKENNCPDRLQNLFLPHINGTHLVVASRDTATPVFRITAPLTVGIE